MSLFWNEEIEKKSQDEIRYFQQERLMWAIEWAYKNNIYLHNVYVK